MNLHCIGDSHSCFFLGENRISAEYPKKERGVYRNVFCYRLGSPLAYNLNKENTKTRAREKLLTIIASFNPLEDIILLSFGEVDCRAHLLKKSDELNCHIDSLVQQCVQNYLEVVRELLEKGFKVIIWNAVYSANYDESYNFEYPYYGDLKSRNKLTKFFNQELHEKQSIGFIFLDATDYLLDPKTLITKNEFYFDEIHLSNKLFLKIIKEIKFKIPGFRPIINYFKLFSLLDCFRNSI